MGKKLAEQKIPRNMTMCREEQQGKIPCPFSLEKTPKTVFRKLVLGLDVEESIVVL